MHFELILLIYCISWHEDGAYALHRIKREEIPSLNASKISQDFVQLKTESELLKATRKLDARAMTSHESQRKGKSFALNPDKNSDTVKVLSKQIFSDDPLNKKQSSAYNLDDPHKLNDRFMQDTKSDLEMNACSIARINDNANDGDIVVLDGQLQPFLATMSTNANQMKNMKSNINALNKTNRENSNPTNANPRTNGFINTHHPNINIVKLMKKYNANLVDAKNKSKLQQQQQQIDEQSKSSSSTRVLDSNNNKNQLNQEQKKQQQQQQQQQYQREQELKHELLALATKQGKQQPKQSSSQSPSPPSSSSSVALPFMHSNMKNNKNNYSKFAPVENVIKFANMLLYKVGLDNGVPVHAQSAHISINPKAMQPPTGSNIIGGGDVGESMLDPLDYFYNTLDPLARAMMTAGSGASMGVGTNDATAYREQSFQPQSLIVQSAAPTFTLNEQPLLSSSGGAAAPSPSFNFLENALDMLLNGDQDNDDEIELRCPLHPSKKSVNQTTTGSGGSVFGATPVGNELDDGNNVIQVCSCRLYKKKST